MKIWKRIKTACGMALMLSLTFQLVIFAQDEVLIIGDSKAGAVDDSAIVSFSFEGDYVNAADDTVGENYGRRVFGEGIEGSAVYLNGDGDYVVVNKESNITGDFTFNVWVNTDEDNKKRGKAYIFAKLEEEDTGFYSFRLENNRPSFYGYNPDAGEAYHTTSTELEAGKWYMLTFVYQGEKSKLTMYIDGQYDTSFECVPIITDTNDTVTIGRSYYGGDDYNRQYQGWIDELNLYTRAFSEEEVMDLYKDFIG